MFINEEGIEMRLHHLYPAILAGALVLGACGLNSSSTSTESSGDNGGVTTRPEQELTRLWIGSELIDCQGEAPQKCMQVAESEDGDYEFFYDEIAGFTFTEGTSYVIDVTIEEVADPPADGSSLSYTLVRVIEETEVTG